MSDRRSSAPSLRTRGEPSSTPLFGDVLRRFRRAASLTQEELAERSTLSPRAISDLERGERRWPQRETVHLLAEALALSPADRALLEASARGRDNAASVRRTAPTPHNLPAAVTPIVGRAREIADVSALLRQTDLRLATITGPGGVGKTRLALAVAAAVRDDFPDGVYLVSLAPVRDPEDLITTIARALDVGERGDRPVWEGLIARLQGQRLLLTLDNFEHLLGEATVVANLLAYCERLTILVTSREVLHLRGEYEYVVPPIALPAPQAADHAALAENPAVMLFCARARAARQDFQLTAENAAPIAALCVRLDGLPLAIELAAARVKFFTPAALHARLHTRLPELRDGPRDAPARHRTMRQTIAWSERLLDETEQALFRQLAVFVGGWTFAAAESVSLGDTGATEALLTSLGEKHLIQADLGEQGEPRFTMLETIRECGAERLSEHREEAEAQRRHAAYFLALAEQAEPELRGAAQATWLIRLDREHDNLLAALRWARETGEIEHGMRLTAALWRFWQGRGHLREARTWLEAFLIRDDETGNRATPSVRAKALNAAGAAAYRAGDQVRASLRFTQSLDLRRAQGDKRGIANALNNLGLVAHEQGELARARGQYAESLALWRELAHARGIAMVSENLGAVLSEQGDYAAALALKEESLALKESLGDTWGIALTTSNIANIEIEQGNFARAKALAERSLALQESLGDRWGIAVSLGYLGVIASGLEQHERAVALQEESLAIRRELGDVRGVASSLRHLALVTHARGDHARADALLTESLALFWENGDIAYVGMCLESLGQVACARKETRHAARLLAAAAHFRATHEFVLGTSSLPGHERTVTATRAALGDEAFAIAWEAGAAAPLAAIVAEALGKAVAGSRQPEGSGGAPAVSAAKTKR